MASLDAVGMHRDSANSTFPLLRLPRELRLEIFSYLINFGVVLPCCFKPNRDFVVWWFDADGRRVLQHSALLLTSRLLYREALPVLRKVRLLVDDANLIGPLVQSIDEPSRSVLRSVRLNRAVVEQKGKWEEICKGLEKLELRDLTISIEGTDESLRAIRSAADAEHDWHTDAGVGVLPAVRPTSMHQMEWVGEMLSLKGLKRLDVSIPQASLLEGEVRQYLKSRMVGVQVGS
ncbi:MAG: hypothetical protein MMC23_001242 [Stictis urceolatum]|nr:hypothetical protein [Stictis urceolata]